ncbi:hypothetical protein GOP47_0005456 [Adiantum capillus-veneris]|uniref:Uncharacterized protein n=1 Tax=Adiantum capillus-veneris TaxID=13818 RepID=A0A9D4V6S1_ADICA|nr:hypothetical protein GOP47_0005456 [Adiantum capillus-veneris]
MAMAIAMETRVRLIGTTLMKGIDDPQAGGELAGRITTLPHSRTLIGQGILRGQDLIGQVQGGT